MFLAESSIELTKVSIFFLKNSVLFAISCPITSLHKLKINLFINFVKLLWNSGKTSNKLSVILLSVTANDFSPFCNSSVVFLLPF